MVTPAMVRLGVSRVVLQESAYLFLTWYPWRIKLMLKAGDIGHWRNPSISAQHQPECGWVTGCRLLKASFNCCAKIYCQQHKCRRCIIVRIYGMLPAIAQSCQTHATDITGQKPDGSLHIGGSLNTPSSASPTLLLMAMMVLAAFWQAQLIIKVTSRFSI